MLCPDWCELLLWISMIHLLMETMKASRIITHMRSLQQMLHSDHSEMPSSMCPRSLIFQCLEFFEQVIDAWGSVYSSYKYGQTRRKFNCIMYFLRGLLELLGDARVQDFKKVHRYQVWKCYLFLALTILGGRKEREAVLFKRNSRFWAPFHQKTTAGISFVLFLLHFLHLKPF